MAVFWENQDRSWGTALMQTLYNSIVLLNIPEELEFTIIGAVILRRRRSNHAPIRLPISFADRLLRIPESTGSLWREFRPNPLMSLRPEICQAN